jgi:hypothetical protein
METTEYHMRLTGRNATPSAEVSILRHRIRSEGREPATPA